MLRLEKVSSSYGAVTAFNGCSLDVPRRSIGTLLRTN